MPHLPCRIAVILSCFNRKQKTLDAIGCVLAQSALEQVTIDFFVTDDGSQDGTSEAVLARYPEIRILKGNGRLFWNGGMRLAWSEAFKGSYDFFLWLNDDTFLFPDSVRRMLETHALGLGRHGKAGIVVGSTQDEQGRTSYGGERQKGPLRPLTLKTVAAQSHIQSCDTFNGNCVLISNAAAAVLGNLDSHFVHAIGDTDYGLRAKRAGIPMWIMPGHAGRCVNDHYQTGSFTDRSLPLRLRFRRVMEPKGLPWKAWLVLCRRHAGPLWPVYWMWPYLKIVTTSLWFKVHREP
ncbi:glycosyltransferase family 2 protein [Massilia sp. LXY-6]|uniref:glycosyltransferase family 2 protein n=1 Tax=Massilia sp. LXY-6 TaxID=3379823 RepID=UPI003EDF0FC7